jgi:hypothetical protein
VNHGATGLPDHGAGSGGTNSVRPTGHTADTIPPNFNPRDGASVSRVGLPNRYVATIEGELQSDPANPDIFIGSNGRRYLQNDGNWYGVSRDTANDMWCVVQQDNPGKPGIPVERNGNGNWHTYSEVGLQGGHGSAARKANIETEMLAAKQELQWNQVEEVAKRAEMDGAQAAKSDLENHIADLESRKLDATRRRDDASVKASDYQRMADQATRNYEDAKRRYDAEQSKRPVSHANLPSEVQDLLSRNTGPQLTSVFAHESTVRDALHHQRECQDAHREWEGKTRDMERERAHIDGRLNDARSICPRADDSNAQQRACRAAARIGLADSCRPAAPMNRRRVGPESVCFASPPQVPHLRSRSADSPSPETAPRYPPAVPGYNEFRRASRCGTAVRSPARLPPDPRHTGLRGRILCFNPGVANACLKMPAKATATNAYLQSPAYSRSKESLEPYRLQPLTPSASTGPQIPDGVVGKVQGKTFTPLRWMALSIRCVRATPRPHGKWSVSVLRNCLRFRSDSARMAIGSRSRLCSACAAAARLRRGRCSFAATAAAMRWPNVRRPSSASINTSTGAAFPSIRTVFANDWSATRCGAWAARITQVSPLR